MKVGLAGCNYGKNLTNICRIIIFFFHLINHTSLSKVCQSKLGMKSGEITDDSLVAKSAKYPTNGPSQAGPLRKGWCAAVSSTLYVLAS